MINSIIGEKEKKKDKYKRNLLFIENKMKITKKKQKMI
jgi:hypothetical protein